MDRLLDALRGHAAALDNGLAQPRIANIQSFDPKTHSVKVLIQPEGVLTGWLPMGASMVGAGVGIVSPPSAGDQVLVIPQEGDGDTWHVVSRMFHQEALPPTSAATQKPVQSGEVGIFTQGSMLHVVGDIIHIQCGTLKTKGLWQHEGDIEVTGKVTVTDVIKSAVDVFAKTVSLLLHRHTGVQSGGGTSGPPKQ